MASKQIHFSIIFVLIIGLGYTCGGISSPNASESTQDRIPEDDIVAPSTPTPFIKKVSITNAPEFLSPDDNEMLLSATKSSKPDLVRFEVYDSESDEICIRAQMKMSVSVPYYVNGSEQMVYYTNATLHKGVKYEGYCTNNSWHLNMRLHNDWNISAVWYSYYKKAVHSIRERLHLSEPAEVEYYSLNSIILYYYLDNDTSPFINESKSYEASSYQSERFGTPFTGYYSCLSNSQLRIGQAIFYLSDFKMQIYKSGNSTHFTGSPVVQCLNDIPVNSIVPIAVGIALAVLTVVILLAYVIGRQRYPTVEYEQLVVHT